MRIEFLGVDGSSTPRPGLLFPLHLFHLVEDTFVLESGVLELGLGGPIFIELGTRIGAGLVDLALGDRHGGKRKQDSHQSNDGEKKNDATVRPRGSHAGEG